MGDVRGDFWGKQFDLFDKNVNEHRENVSDILNKMIVHVYVLVSGYIYDDI